MLSLSHWTWKLSLSSFLHALNLREILRKAKRVRRLRELLLPVPVGSGNILGQIVELPERRSEGGPVHRSRMP